MTQAVSVPVVSPGIAALARPAQWTQREQDLIAGVLAPGLVNNPLHMRAFAAVARHTQLDPFKHELYAWIDGNKLVVHIGIQGWRVLAARTGEYAGEVGPEWCGEDGKWTDVWLLEEPPSGARVGVLRRGQTSPTWGTVAWREFGAPKYERKTKSGGYAHPIWREKPAHMLAVAAERHALRKACPDADALVGNAVAQYAPSASVVDEEPTVEQIAAPQAGAGRGKPAPADDPTLVSEYGPLDGGDNDQDGEALEGRVTARESVEEGGGGLPPSAEQSSEATHSAAGDEGSAPAPELSPRTTGAGNLPLDVNSEEFIDWWAELVHAASEAALGPSDFARLLKPKAYNAANAVAYCRDHGLSIAGLIAAVQEAGAKGR